MDKNTVYGAVNTKVLSMYGKFLKMEDYSKLINLKSPIEIAQYLKETEGYKMAFKGVDVEYLHRHHIEIILKKHLIDFIDKIIHFFHGDLKNFIKCFYIKYEIFDLKRIARLIHVEKDFDNLKESLIFVGKYRFIDVDKIIKATKVSELINLLEGTVYYPFLKNLVDGNEKENLFRFEMSLDRAFFVLLNENAKKLEEDDKKSFYEIYGTLSDMLNLKWIYRSKRYFNLSPEEIFNYTIDFGNKFNYSKIKEFCYSKSLEEFLSNASKTPYAFMFKGDEKQDIYMERRINRYMYFKLKKVFVKRELDISMVLALLELKEFEILDIISIIECVRYSIDVEESKKYLIIDL
ncbi:V-type ATP synthase subunit C [Caloramator mitchellensis]|uniref:V-type ATP synthase subunit C n=1 Tax=Caloramator mitchellensis TaxID=908809 RepID=A0A0R3K0V3_CALMK|nr:V-type ATPase subunit [Caloramator mitchellensis]KRQ85903.1 V-type ATP synthase subunit C [Caloramator mitchellensis]